MESKNASDKPINSNNPPKIKIKTRSEPILTIAENPILVDSIDCNFAVNIDEIVKGIKEINRIWRLEIPVEYLGKNSLIKNGAKTIPIITIIIDPIIAK